jgi:hypothetical protein
MRRPTDPRHALPARLRRAGPKHGTKADPRSKANATGDLLPVVTALLLFVFLAGCASKQGPERLRVDADTYHAAFDAALEAAQKHGMPPTLRDRRHGVIETQPALASTVLEPWRGDNASFGQAVENTIAFQRRRARFEFTPADGAAAQEPDDAPETGPDLLGLDVPELDLNTYAGDLELTVRVYVDQAYAMGIRRSTWSRRSTTRAQIDSPSSDGSLPAEFWTPVTRDEAFERRLLAAVDRALQRRQPR